MLNVVAYLALGAATSPLLASVNKGEETVSLVDIRSRKEIAKLPTGTSPQEVIFMGKSRWAVVSNMGTGPAAPGRTLTVVDVAEKKVAKTIDLGEHKLPHGLIALDDQRLLMTSHMTDHLVVVNVETGKVERSMPSGGKGTHLVVLSPDHKRAYAANVGSETVSVVDVDSGKLLATIEAGSRAEGISISPDGTAVAIGNVGANSVTLIDAKTFKVTRTLENLLLPIRTFFSSDSKRLYVSCANSGEIAAFKADGSERIGTVNLKAETGFKFWTDSKPIPMNFDRRGKEIWVAIINANEVLAFDENTLKVTGRYPTGHFPDGIAVLP